MPGPPALVHTPVKSGVSAARHTPRVRAAATALTTFTTWATCDILHFPRFCRLFDPASVGGRPLTVKEMRRRHMTRGRSFAWLTLWLGAAPILAAETASFQASSPDISAAQPIAGKFIYNGFGCSGQNVSPAVMWKNAPAGTKSFAVMVHDPDAPTGG